MGKVVLVYGESGVGKSASLRNFEPNEIGIFNVSGKPLPFKKKLPVIMSSDMRYITAKLMENSMNCYVVDDAGLSMTFYLFDKVNESGYGKFTQVAKQFYDMVHSAVVNTTDDTIIYFLMHEERSEDGVRLKAKTAGKMIDSQISLESLFTVVLYATTDGRKHVFVTQSDGSTTAKSPMEMFDLEIDNDLKAVDTTIREYYGLAPAGPTGKKKAAVTTADTVPEVQNGKKV